MNDSEKGSNQVKSIELYDSLVQKTDAFESKLLAAYGEHIKCTRGCSSCCILESVFPVEAYKIYSSMQDREIIQLRALTEENGKCVFLYDGACSIYTYRPIICRTHGYPVFTDGRVDFCPENFTNIQQIDSGYILDLEALNRALVSIDLLFVRENHDVFFSAERITLADLKMKILAGD